MARSALIRWVMVATLLALVAAACGGEGSGDGTSPTTQAPVTQAGDVAAGETHYMQSCQSCHGPDAKGLEGLGKSLIGSDFIDGLSDAELVEFIKVGRSTSDPLNTSGVDMPPKGGNPVLTDADLQDIVAFIRSIN